MTEKKSNQGLVLFWSMLATVTILSLLSVHSPVLEFVFTICRALWNHQSLSSGSESLTFLVKWPPWLRAHHSPPTQCGPVAAYSCGPFVSCCFVSHCLNIWNTFISIVDWQWVLFSFWPLWIRLQCVLEHICIPFCGCIPRGGNTGLWCLQMSSLLDRAREFSKVVISVNTPSRSAWECWVLHIFNHSWYCLLF